MMQNTMRSVGILGMGAYVPDKVVTNRDFEQIVDTSDEWIVARTGIKERRFAAQDQATSDMAYQAAIKALRSSNTSAEDLDLIIMATVCPDKPFPATACLVQHRLGATRAAAFDLEAACSGFVYGLGVGAQFIKTGVYERVLVIGAETLSRFLDFDDRNTCVLMGDGAGAAVLGPVESGSGILSMDLGADGSGSDLLQIAAGGSRLPTSEETVKNRQHYVNMNGREVFKVGVRRFEQSIRIALEKAGLGVDDLSLLVPHQANIRIIEAAASRIKLPMERVMVNIHRYGNTSAASIPIALSEALEKGRIEKGDVTVLVAFGGGLTWGSMAIRW